MKQQGEQALTRFLGRWTLGREIRDFRTAARMRFDGVLDVDRAGDALRVHEHGTLLLPDRTALTASRVYSWAADGDRIAVRFADGRPFHAFDPAEPCPEVRHDCGPDTYVGRYEFAGWPVWRLTWRVSGPHKDWTSETVAIPGGAAGLASRRALGHNSGEAGEGVRA